MAGVWTNNWRAFRNIMLMGSHYNGFSTITTVNGTSLSNRYSDAFVAATPMGKYGISYTDSTAPCTLRLGTGNAAPTAADYFLTSEANVSILSIVTTDPSYDTETRTMTRVFSLSVQNQTAVNITIQEWGIIGAIRVLGYSASNIANCLLYHEVLDNGVTLAPLQAATLTLTMTLTLTDIL